MAMTHIQKMAPGPPETMAVATPTMLPVPMVPASAVHMLWNWLMAMSSLLVWAVTSLLVNTAPMVCRIQWPTRRNWKPPVRNVIHRPVQNSSARPMGPQTMPLTALLTVVIHSTILYPLYTQKCGQNLPKGSARKKLSCSVHASCTEDDALSFCLRD